MKIEKLTRDNIGQFIIDLRLEDTDSLEKNVDKSNLYGLKDDDTFCLGFNSSTDAYDSIAIVFYSSKLSPQRYLEAVEFLSQNLVVDNHLIISVYNDKHMKLMDDLYKCKEVIVTLKLNNQSSCNSSMREKYADIDMKSIRYLSSKNEVICNLIKQNIQDEKTILGLHEFFKELNVNTVSFVVFDEISHYFTSLGYECFSKSYIIRK